MHAIHTPDAPAAIGPYQQAVWAGSTLFLSGQLGLHPQTGILCRGVKAQAQQAFQNIEAILTAASLDLSNVVKMTIFVQDLQDFAIVNRVMQNVFDSKKIAYPARSCVEVARLPKDSLVEIRAIAYRHE